MPVLMSTRGTRTLNTSPCPMVFPASGARIDEQTAVFLLTLRDKDGPLLKAIPGAVEADYPAARQFPSGMLTDGPTGHPGEPKSPRKRVSGRYAR